MSPFDQSVLLMFERLSYEAALSEENYVTERHFHIFGEHKTYFSKYRQCSHFEQNF